MKVAVLGAGWVSAAGWGRGALNAQPGFPSGEVLLPSPVEVFLKTPARWGRFDAFCRMGSSAAGLALKEAGLWPSPPTGTGMLVASRWETTQTDRAFHQSTLVEGGALSSPNLFSYTLPATVLGECAAAFSLLGPTFCMGDSGGKGLDALRAAASLLASKASPVMLVARIESPPPEASLASGALCIALALPGAYKDRAEKLWDLDALDLSLSPGSGGSL